MTGRSTDSERSYRQRPAAGNDDTELQRAINGLEEAVQGVLRSAKDDFSDRAASLLHETSRRLRSAEETLGGARRRRTSDLDDPPMQSRRLYRDPYNRRIGGVCAGFARYFGVETWVTRLIAVTGLIFLPSLMFPAYWIAYFLMDTPDVAPRRRRRPGHDHRSPAPELGARYSPRRSLRNVQADLTAVELRLRRMEGHVTSDQYQLRKELDALDRQGG